MSNQFNASIRQEIRDLFRRLSPDEQRIVLQELQDIEQHPEEHKPRHNLTELEGLGAEIWQGIDPQEYVNRERDSWDEREEDTQ